MSETSKRSTLLIRVVFKSDVPALTELANQLGYASEPLEITSRLKALMELEDHEIFVAEVADVGVVGWVQVMEAHRLVSEPFAELGGLIVEQGWRGQGAGSLLLERAEGWARSRDLALIRVNSNTARQGVPAFYESQGYKLVKTQNVFQKFLM
jgi:GNAT superfamily N-acetyltransferase